MTTELPQAPSWWHQWSAGCVAHHAHDASVTVRSNTTEAGNCSIVTLDCELTVFVQVR